MVMQEASVDLQIPAKLHAGVIPLAGFYISPAHLLVFRLQSILKVQIG